MRTLARAEDTGAGWDDWLMALTLPWVCVLADYAIGEHVLRMAPAALLGLAALGSAGFILARRAREDALGLVAVGPLWLCGAVAALVGGVLTLLVCVGVLLAAPLALVDPSMVQWLPFALLATTPICTATIYLLRGKALARTLAATHGTRTTLAAGLGGALIAGAAILSADALDRRWVNARVDALPSDSADMWPTMLASLHAYPLCGRERCKQHICARLFTQFGEAPAGGMRTTPDAPPQYDAAFRQVFGVSIGDACKRYD